MLKKKMRPEIRRGRTDGSAFLMMIIASLRPETKWVPEDIIQSWWGTAFPNGLPMEYFPPSITPRISLGAVILVMYQELLLRGYRKHKIDVRTLRSGERGKACQRAWESLLRTDPEYNVIADPSYEAIKTKKIDISGLISAG